MLAGKVTKLDKDRRPDYTNIILKTRKGADNVVLTQSAVFISELVISFALYSLLGWACESTYCSIPAKKFINRGFLNGPFCPIYGVGALLVIFLLRPFTKNIVVLFVFGVLITSVVEYITSLLLEKLFHTTWWDYSKRRFNINGRVCLRNSLLFGVLSVLLVHFINPFVEKLEGWIPEPLLPVIAFVFLFYFITDSVITVRSILAMNGKLDELEKVLEDLKAKSEENRERLQQSFESKVNATREAVLELQAASSERLQERMEAISKGLNSGAQRRLLKAFPGMRAGKHPASIRHMKEAVQRKQVKKKKEK